MTKYKGTKVLTGFDVRSKTPIDPRTVQETLQDMYMLDTAFDGLIVSNLEDGIVYVRLNGYYEPLGSATSNGAFTYSMPLRLSGDTNNENDYLIRT